MYKFLVFKTDPSSKNTKRFGNCEFVAIFENMTFMTTVEKQLEEFASSYGCYLQLNNQMYSPYGVYPLSYLAKFQNEIVFEYNVHEQKYTIFVWKTPQSVPTAKYTGGGFDNRLRAYIPERIKEIKRRKYETIYEGIKKDFE